MCGARTAAKTPGPRKTRSDSIPRSSLASCKQVYHLTGLLGTAPSPRGPHSRPCRAPVPGGALAWARRTLRWSASASQRRPRSVQAPPHAPWPGRPPPSTSPRLLTAEATLTCEFSPGPSISSAADLANWRPRHACQPAQGRLYSHFLLAPPPPPPPRPQRTLRAVNRRSEPIPEHLRQEAGLSRRLGGSWGKCQPEAPPPARPAVRSRTAAPTLKCS